MKLLISFFVLSVLLISCKSSKKRPGEIIVTGNDIEAHWFVDATLYSASEVVSITKGDSSVEVLKLKSNIGIADILIGDNTITIQCLPRQGVLYFREEAFNYKVKLDTSISYPYWRQKNVEWDKQRD